MISIIIATYNRTHTLSKAIESVCAQTEKDIEIVVVDDGSTDATESVVKELIQKDSRIRYVKLESNQGASSARNRGIQEAKGEWVMVWDSDDILDSEALETVKKILTQHPEATVVSAPARMMRNGVEVEHRILPEGFVTLEDVLCKRIGNNEKIRIARKDAYLKAQYVSKNIDFVVGARLRAQGEWFHSTTKLGTVYLEGKNSLSVLRKKKNIDISIERSKHLTQFLEEFGEKLREACSGRYGAICYGASIGLLLSGDTISSRLYAHRAWVADRHIFRFFALRVLTFLPGAESIARLLFSYFDSSTT